LRDKQAPIGHWDEVLAEPHPPENLEYSNAIWHYVRATAYARLGNLDAARDISFKTVSDHDGVIQPGPDPDGTGQPGGQRDNNGGIDPLALIIGE
jgi:hypothetical protein